MKEMFPSIKLYLDLSRPNWIMLASMVKLPTSTPESSMSQTSDTINVAGLFVVLVFDSEVLGAYDERREVFRVVFVSRRPEPEPLLKIPDHPVVRNKA